MTKQKIYISGAITGTRGHELTFKAAEVYLTSKGVCPINPVNLDIKHPPKSWRDALERDINQLFKCDAIYMLKGWEKSKGAFLEWIIAKELGLKIFYEDVGLSRTI